MLNTETLALDAATSRRHSATSSPPGDKEYDLARRAWNLAVDQRPALVAFPADAADVVAVVAFARARGLRVAPQGTGHNAAPLPRSSDTILLSTQRMRGVEIDATAQIARVAGRHAVARGHRGRDRRTASTRSSGSSPDVGVVGYTLGGGLSWLARKHGLAANSVTAIELVTADGELRARDRRRARRPLLGAPRRRRQLRRRDRDGVPPLPVRRGLRGHDAVPVRARRARSCTPGATGRAPRRRRSRPRSGSCTSRRCRSCRRSCRPLRRRRSTAPTLGGAEAGAAALLAPLRALGPEMDTFAPSRRPR